MKQTLILPVLLLLSVINGGCTLKENGNGRTIQFGAAPAVACSSGKLSNQVCYYLAAINQSCRTFCAGHGGDHPATIDTIGAGGTQANCAAVAGLFGISQAAGDLDYLAQGPGAPRGIGCAIRPDKKGYVYDVAFPTVPEGRDDLSQRLCACKD